MNKTSNPRFQFGILTALLVMTAFATWTSWFLSKNDAERLARQLPALRNSARELDIVDVDQYAISRLLADWFGELKWRLFLPDSGSYRVCLATEDIDQSGYPEAEETYELMSGRHNCEFRIKKDSGQYVLEFLVDEKVVLTKIQPTDWNPDRGKSTSGAIGFSQQQPTDQPFQIHRSRFMEPVGEFGAASPQGPSNGVLIWIEKVGNEQK